MVLCTFQYPNIWLQDIVTGLDAIIFSDLMEAIEWFFTLHDKDKDGFLTKDEVLQLSESLLVGLCRFPTSMYTDCISSSYLDTKSAMPTLAPLVDS